MRSSAAILATALLLAACDDPKPAAPASAVAASPPKPLPPATPAEVAAFKSQAHEMLATMKLCDDAVARGVVISKRRDIYKTYRASVEADRTCTASAGDIRSVHYGAPLLPARAAILDGMREQCALAQERSADHMQAVSAVLNGDATPEAVSNAQDAQEAANRGGVLCMVGIVPAAHAAGLDGWSVIPKR